MMITKVSGLRRLISRRTSRPPISGMSRSTTASAYEVRLNASMAARGSLNVSTARSSRCNARPSERQRLASSSMSIMEQGILPHLAGAFGTRGFGPDGQRNGEYPPPPPPRSHGDPAAMRGDDAVADGEPEPKAGPAFLGGVEGIENVIQVRGRDAAAVIGEFDQRRAPPTLDRLGGAHPDHTLAVHGGGGVEQRIEEYFLEAMRIDPEQRQGRNPTPTGQRLDGAAV